jgi:cytochrome c2
MRFPRNRWVAPSLRYGAGGVVAGVLAVRAWHWLRPARGAPTSAVVADPLLEDLILGTALAIAPASPPSRSVVWRMAFVTGLVLLAVVFGGAVFVQRQGQARHIWAEQLTGGSTEPAIALMTNNGCGGCHQIPGVPGADGNVGPPLSGIASRAYLGGATANSPEHLVAWIRDARSIAPHTAMPTIGVSVQEARDMAAYLYAQR